MLDWLGPSNILSCNTWKKTMLWECYALPIIWERLIHGWGITSQTQNSIKKISLFTKYRIYIEQI